MMKSLSPISLIALAACITSCAKPPEVYSICFRGSKDAILATGTMKIREPSPPEGKARGTYTLILHDNLRDNEVHDWFFRLIGDGKEKDVEWSTQANQPEGWRNTFDFAPDRHDANITARAPGLTSGQATGIWSYAIVAGGFQGGKLELKLHE